MDYPIYEFRGLRECPYCRKVSGEQFRIQDHKGASIGTLDIQIACGCYPNSNYPDVRPGEELGRTER